MKKIKIYGEIVYLISLIVISFSVAMLTAVDYGISMIVAPAYILSQKLTFLTFGQCEYIIQGILFILFCILMKKVKPIYLVSFLTCLIYGLFLDLWRVLIPAFNPSITPVGSMETWVRITFFIVGNLLTSLSVALSFKAYIYPQVYDFFVRDVVYKYKLKAGLFKTLFDLTFLAIGVVLTLCFFGKFVGIKWGTMIIAVINGSIITFFSNLYDRLFVTVPLFPKLQKLFRNE
jgi:uncharacterized membrane protein YczE